MVHGISTFPFLAIVLAMLWQTRLTPVLYVKLPRGQRSVATTVLAFSNNVPSNRSGCKFPCVDDDDTYAIYCRVKDKVRVSLESICKA